MPQDTQNQQVAHPSKPSQEHRQRSKKLLIFEQFKREYDRFLTFVTGIPSQEHRRCYTSITLCRLMLVYFMQKKKLLDDDEHYLSHRLRAIQESHGKASFYHQFLLRLFHDGLGSSARTPELRQELGDIPFLHGVLFEKHPLEREYEKIQIADEAFERILDFFNKWRWHLDNRPLLNESEINPDILGCIFEKYTNQNQKEMGAYYTKADITAYIARNAIIPFLFDATELADLSQSGRAIWQLLQADPDRYIYEAVREGVMLPLPPEIELGIADVSRRATWNRLASPEYALPGETWRDVVARRERYQGLRRKLEAGAIHTINDLITYNLNICQFVQDALAYCDDAEFILAFYENLTRVTILDPTCGSGSFLLAALHMLEPLYQTCIKRMQRFIHDADYADNHAATTSVSGATYLNIFRAILVEIQQHASVRFFIIKSIIMQNIYGVDLSREAVEVCRLRIFLKLLALVDSKEHLQLLPGVDFNIRTGNALIGFVTNEEALNTISLTPDLHQPFHWFVEWPRLMHNGGFDVIIGNPPYIEYEKVSKTYKLTHYHTLPAGNLYALTMERCFHLLAPGGRFGMIVPSSATCTDGYLPLQKLLLEQSALHISSYSDQRGKLFDIPHPRLCIILYQKGSASKNVYSTSYIKLGRELRDSLFQRLEYIEVTDLVKPGIIPRYSSAVEQRIHAKLHSQRHRLGDYLSGAGSHRLYYTRKLSWYVQVTPFIPQIFNEQGRIRNPSELKTLRFASPIHADIAFVALNSHLFYWFLTTGSDCRNLNMREVLGFPLDIAMLPTTLQQTLQKLALELAQDLQAHSELKTMHFQHLGNLTIQCMFPGRSISILNEIDLILATHYGFSDEELDFIINYDFKYRVGPNTVTRTLNSKEVSK